SVYCRHSLERLPQGLSAIDESSLQLHSLCSFRSSRHRSLSRTCAHHSSLVRRLHSVRSGMLIASRTKPRSSPEVRVDRAINMPLLRSEELTASSLYHPRSLVEMFGVLTKK